jgi:membrane protein YqaA with SNARE-associated domain
MRFFSYLYNKMLAWSAHDHAPYYLAGVSFAESSFFPIPPDVMLISMSLAKPPRVWRYALITSVASVIGGIFGYLLGAFFLDLIYPLIVKFGYLHAYQQVHVWFQAWGFWVVFIAGFSPIPYKLFTIGAGAMRMAFFPFLLASAVSRSARFFLVGTVMHYAGPKLDGFIHKYIDMIGWLVTALIVIGYMIFR